MAQLFLPYVHSHQRSLILVIVGHVWPHLAIKPCKLLINPLYAGIQRCVCGMYIGRDEWGILFRAAEQIFYPQEYSAPIYVCIGC